MNGLLKMDLKDILKVAELKSLANHFEIFTICLLTMYHQNFVRG